jgi:hypothetical protein
MLDHLPSLLQDRVRTVLIPDEEVWWVGQPSRWDKGREDLFFSLFEFAVGMVVILGIAFAVWADWRGSTEEALKALAPSPVGLGDFLHILTDLSLFVALLAIFGIILAFGVGCVISSVTRPIASFAAVRDTIYVVTNRRALDIGPYWRKAIEPDQMPFLEKVSGKNVFFSCEIVKDSDGDESLRPVGFACLRDSFAAESALLKLLRQTNKLPTGQHASDAEAAASASTAPDVPKTQCVEVQQELRQGERVRWLGWPRRTLLGIEVRRLRSPLGMLLLVIFGLVLLLCAALLFIGVELSFLAGGGYRRRRTRRTVYAVTDRRAMIVVAPGHVISFLPSQLRAMKTESEDGLSAVYFHQPVVKGNERKYWSGFEALADPSDALRALDLLQRMPVRDPDIADDISHHQ